MPRGVTIFLNREEYDSLIVNHGQYALWTSSAACPCVSGDRSAADPDCQLCGGRGRRYYFETEFKIIKEKLTMNLNEGIALYGDIVSIDKVYDSSLNVQCFHGKQVIFDSIPDKSKNVYVDYTYSIKRTSVNVQGIYRGRGIIEFPSLIFESKHGIDVSYEITAASNVENKDRIDKIDVLDTYKNFVYIDHHYSVAQIGDTFEADIEYILPHLFQLVGITPQMRYERFGVIEEAEVQLTVPNHINIAEGDLVTMLVSEQAFSIVKEFHTESDVLGHYDISRIIRVEDEKGVVYVEGTDWSKLGRDRIRILNKEMYLGAYSIKYLYREMFIALKSMPMQRYGENQLLPHRIMLKSHNRFTTEPIEGV